MDVRVGYVLPRAQPEVDWWGSGVLLEGGPIRAFAVFGATPRIFYFTTGT